MGQGDGCLNCSPHLSQQHCACSCLCRQRVLSPPDNNYLCDLVPLPLCGNSIGPKLDSGSAGPWHGITAGREASPHRETGNWSTLTRPPRPGRPGYFVTPAANKWGDDGRGSGAPGAGLRGRRRGGGSPFWPLSAAYQESERKAHRQKSSSVRKVPLRSLISPGARRAPVGPRLHGPGDRGRGAGAGRRRGPRPRSAGELRARERRLRSGREPDGLLLRDARR